MRSLVGWGLAAVWLVGVPGLVRAQEQPVQPVLRLSLADARARDQRGIRSRR